VSVNELKTLDKGKAWEFRVHRAAFLSGWYIRRSVNLRERVAGSPQTMAEVDILGLAFDVALVPKLTVGECKDRKGGAKEADRVVWLLGLKQALKAEHVMFAKTKISDGTYTWARPFELLLWDEAAVRAIERAHELEPDSSYVGSFNVALSERGQGIKKLPREATRLRAAWDYLGGAFWYSPAVARAKRLAAYFDVVGEAKLDDDARDLFVAEGLVALLAAALTTAGQLRRISPARAKVALEDAFAAGAASATTLRDIAARADDYYRDAWVRTARERGEAEQLTVPRLASHVAEVPVWLGEYVELARRLGAKPQHATDLLRFSDLLLFEQIIAASPVPATILATVGADVADLMRLVQLAGYFLRRVWGVEARLLTRLLEDGQVEVAPTMQTTLGLS
jgi:hypothetical protein